MKSTKRNIEIAEEILRLTTEFGFMSIKKHKGSFLQTKEYMIEEQKEWCDEDDCKDFCFESYNFWLTTDDGQEPQGINFAKELVEILPNPF